MSELKVCPFCGEAPVVHRLGPLDLDQWAVSCESLLCEIMPTTDAKRSREGAIAAWNTRPLEKELAEALYDIRMSNAGTKERERGWNNALTALEKAGLA